MTVFLLPLVVLLLLVPGDDKPAPKLPLGKETTYVIGPLDKHGYIDYEAALNAELSRGVTAQNNANVLLIQAFGPAPEGGDGLPLAYFKWLDLPPLPKEGDYFVSLSGFARDTLSLTDAQLTALYDQQSATMTRPWATQDNPVIAEWLKANEKPLALVVEATKRPRYYNPLVTRKRDGEPGALIGFLLPSVQKCRELAVALTARAMLRVHDKKFDDAWADLLACHRLGRLVAQGGTLIESLVGFALGQIASTATLTYLDQVPLTSKQIRERSAELQQLPPWPTFAERVDLGERFLGLDSLQNIRRSQLQGLDFGDDEDRKLTAEELKALEALDWAAMFREVNRWYDRMVAAARQPSRAERMKAFAALDDELIKLTKKKIGPRQALALLGKPDQTAKTISLSIVHTLMGLLLPSFQRVQGAYDRVEQVGRNLQVAFALAAYRADTGKYPAKLDDLVPNYLAKVPGDLFSGKQLIYRAEKAGYVLYSVGQNEMDDGGRSFDDDPPGDDLLVKMPLPPLKRQE
jgi:ribosomal protein L17